MKNILVGVSGGIAAYKAVELVSRLKKNGYNVDVVMTENACHFVTPRLFQEISGRAVYYDMWQDVSDWHTEHISLAARADAVIIAPATANIIGKIAHGIADDMLSTVILATNAPIYIAPAMNCNMLNNVAVQNNLQLLRERGMKIIPSASGQLACGDIGAGRLPEPEILANILIQQFSTDDANRCTWLGKKVVITAGGTREPIDPVRYIGNRSSGKMGYALAEAAAAQGAEVILISTTDLKISQPQIVVKKVDTAQQMMVAVQEQFADADVIIKAAAVADYRVADISTQKIKKKTDCLQLQLVKNPDILATLGKNKGSKQILVGFAAETENIIEHGLEKLHKKNLDMIVVNDVSRADRGFDSNDNAVTLLLADGRQENIDLSAKTEIAQAINARITDIMRSRGLL